MRLERHRVPCKEFAPAKCRFESSLDQAAGCGRVTRDTLPIGDPANTTEFCGTWPEFTLRSLPEAHVQLLAADRPMKSGLGPPRR